jgi:hypothetical protein
MDSPALLWLHQPTSIRQCSISLRTPYEVCYQLHCRHEWCLALAVVALLLPLLDQLLLD